MTTGTKTLQSRQFFAEKADSRPPIAVNETLVASPQNRAFAALEFHYRRVIGREVGELRQVIRTRKPKRLPVIQRQSVFAVLYRLLSHC